MNISAQIIDLSTKNSILLSAVMEETGGIGVDIVLDNGGKTDRLVYIREFHKI